MNQMNLTAFWHKASFEQLMQERLPQLLAERLPVSGYQYEPTGVYTCQVRVTVMSNGEEVEALYANLPQPDAEGIYRIDGVQQTIVACADHEALDQAAIQCGGDLMYDFIAERLGAAPPDLPWTESLLRTWLPLDKWLAEFMTSHPYAQQLDATNWLAQHTHLRRLIVTHRQRYSTAGQIGRTCPFEQPEGPNLGRIFSVARGAAIQDGKLLIVDSNPDAAIGLSASMIPCLEHDDPNRLLMGANMMRQWLPYAQPEPAFVQTGNEPAVPDFWCGRNLLTAFIPWGGDSYEDGIILSQSAAQRLSNVDHQVEPGDKLSNRHGSKGVVSRILPDAQMPRLPDGSVVDLLFSGLRLPGRQNLGQLWEAVLGRLARAEGIPVIAPPFHGPTEETVRQRLNLAGLATDGLEPLLAPETGTHLPNRATVGWVYWGRTNHLARDKMQVAGDSGAGMQRQGELEAQLLLELGAMETIREHFHARRGEREIRRQGDKERGREGEESTLSLRFDLLQRRLAALGIQATLEGNQLRCSFAPGSDQSDRVIRLARPIPHPWLSERLMQEVGFFPAQHEIEAIAPNVQSERWLAATQNAPPMPEYVALREANNKLIRLLQNKTPDALVGQAQRQVELRLQAYADALLSRDDLYFDNRVSFNRVSFSGRTVAAPGPHLRHDQVGVAEEMAWTLFGPQVARMLGDAQAVTERSVAASRQLDDLLARSWVIINRAPSIKPTSMIAFHPLRDPGKVIRLPMLACRPLDVDFDGDQVAIFVPQTEAGQQEAGRILTLAGHLKRDPGLIHELAPTYEAMWGLAQLSRQPNGLAEMAAVLGVPLVPSEPFVTRAVLIQALETVLASQGAEQTLAVIDQLIQRGLAAAQASALSLSPFVDSQWQLPPAPFTGEIGEWQRYHEQVLEQLLACTDLDHGVGPYVLAVKCGAVPVGYLQTLAQLLGVLRVVTDVHGHNVIPTGGYRQGLSLESFWQLIPGAREGLARAGSAFDQALADPYSLRQSPREEKSFHLLARARRARTPGIVFARAAAIGEVDPLVDVESRLFVGV